MVSDFVFLWSCQSWAWPTNLVHSLTFAFVYRPQLIFTKCYEVIWENDRTCTYNAQVICILNDIFSWTGWTGEGCLGHSRLVLVGLSEKALEDALAPCLGYVWFGMVGIDGCCMLLPSACSPRLMRTVYNRYKSVQEIRFRRRLLMSLGYVGMSIHVSRWRLCMDVHGIRFKEACSKISSWC